MSDFSVISKEQLQPILEAFRAIEWPLDPMKFREIAGLLGWAVEYEFERGLGMIANLPVDLDYVSVVIDDDSVTQVELRATDTLDDENLEVTRTAFKQLRGYAAELFDDVGTYQSSRSRVYWDTPAGGRIVLECLDDTVLLDVLSQRYADIERAEQRQGLDPDVPIADHQESQR